VPSAHRCDHFPDCVGCPWVATPYAEQQLRKQQRVERALARYASIAVKPAPLVPAPRLFGYRNLVKLVARGGRRGLRLGVYHPGSHRLADIRRCAAHHPTANAVLARVAHELEARRVPTYDERRRTGWLRYVLVRVGAERRAQLVLVVRDRGYEGERALAQALARIPGVAGVVLNENADPGNAIWGERFETLAGSDTLEDRVGGFALASRAGVFVQGNLGAARAAYAEVLRAADPRPGERALDLYCGVGALALALARAGAQVTGVEESPRAVEDARENARRHGLDARFLAGDAGAVLADLIRQGARADLVTLNPPRRGTDAAVRSAIAQLAPSRIVYLSCDPETLARDLDDLASRGYATRSVQPYDFLPHTEHVEAVAVLRPV
jgi:23S rRNA (uracil1939-C5)-methyltransferase